MNYFELHVGDYESATAHLSIIEDGIYNRLLRVYYRTEQPLPVEVKQCCRLVRAVSKAERDTVGEILREFFELRDDGWHNVRADEEIARYQDKQRKAKASADARWAQRQPHDGRNANASPDAMRTHMRTHSEGNAPRARPQTPDTRHQTPEEPRTATASGDARVSDDPPDPDATPTPAGRVCRLMRQAGIAEANPGHPDLLALIAAGATDAEFEHAAKVAVGRERGFAYALGVLKGQRTEAAKVTPLRAGKHAGFTAKDYRDGVAEDGSFS